METYVSALTTGQILGIPTPDRNFDAHVGWRSKNEKYWNQAENDEITMCYTLTSGHRLQGTFAVVGPNRMFLANHEPARHGWFWF